MKFLLINTCYFNSNLFFKQYPQIKDSFNVEVFKEKEVLKPKFLKEEKGLSAAERGTVIHYVMQRLNYDRVSTISEIKSQIEEMILDNSLTEKEASAVWYKKIYNFFNGKLGERVLKAY